MHVRTSCGSGFVSKQSWFNLVFLLFVCQPSSSCVWSMTSLRWRQKYIFHIVITHTHVDSFGIYVSMLVSHHWMSCFDICPYSFRNTILNLDLFFIGGDVPAKDHSKLAEWNIYTRFKRSQRWKNNGCEQWNNKANDALSHHTYVISNIRIKCQPTKLHNKIQCFISVRWDDGDDWRRRPPPSPEMRFIRHRPQATNTIRHGDHTFNSMIY